MFAALAGVFGISSFLNSRLVVRFGAAELVKAAILLIIFASITYALLFRNYSAVPPLTAYIVYVAAIMCAFAFLFGNTTSLAMEPMGHIAGAASSVINSLSTAIAIVMATLVGSQLNATPHPVVYGFGLLAVAALAICLSIKKPTADSVSGSV